MSDCRTTVLGRAVCGFCGVCDFRCDYFMYVDDMKMRADRKSNYVRIMNWKIIALPHGEMAILVIERGDRPRAKAKGGYHGGNRGWY